MTADRPGSDGRNTQGVLAYVFWHQPSQEQPLVEYETALTAFHRRLATNPVAGLLETRTQAVPDLPWLPHGGYEDWYVLQGYADLGTLNTAAVDAVHRDTHDDIARRSARGAGGVYALSAGTPSGTPTCITWLSKPRNVTYADFYQQLFAHIGLTEHGPSQSTGVWRRQLVLSPAPEFCISGRQIRAELPAHWSPISVPFRGVHSETSPHRW